MFPSEGEIFVHGNYSLYIDEKYKDGELFELEYFPSKGDELSCNYTASTNTIKELPATKFLRIFNIAYDPKKPKRINTYEITITTPFYINDNNFLYGPFLHDAEDNELLPLTFRYFDFEEYEEGNIVEEILREEEDCIFKYEVNKISNLIHNNYLTDLEKLFVFKPDEVIYLGSKEQLLEWGKSYFVTKLSDEEKQAIGKLKDLQFPDFKRQSDKVKLSLLNNI